MRIERADKTCDWHPSQWDAWDWDGRYYYVRYRHGWLSVNADDVEGPELLAIEVDMPDPGWMATSDMLSIVETLL